MKTYTVYASIKAPKECWNTPTSKQDDAIGAIVNANTVKEAVQLFYESPYCQRFLERNLSMFSVGFYFQHSSGIKIPFYGRIEL